jgi:hypothetical protein
VELLGVDAVLAEQCLDELAQEVQLTSLSRHPDRLKLWVGQTIALFRSQDTYLALPLTAANG